jgi:hypothetical protein
VIITCKYCGNEFEGRAGRKFCNAFCSNRYVSERRTYDHLPHLTPGVVVGLREGTEKRKKLAERVEWLGAMNDRHTAALDRADCAELKRLAAEYKRRGLTKTAVQVQMEAE